MKAQAQLSEDDIKRIIKFYYSTNHPHMSLEDIVVHFQIGNQEISASVAWEDGIKHNEQQFEGEFDLPYGC